MNVKELNLALNTYTAELTHLQKSERTIHKYRSDIRAFIQFAQSIPCDPVQALPMYANSLRAKYKASTCNSYLISINAFLSYMGLPDCKQPLQKIQRRFSLGNELSKQDYYRLLSCLQQIGDMKYYMAARTLAGMGIRVGELAFITAETVGQGWTEIDFKGKVRQIFLPCYLKQELTSYMHRFNINSGPVFLGRHNDVPVHPSTVWRHLKKAAVLANIDESKVFPHNLRHLFARVYMETYGDIVDLADILGHSSIETTRIYTRTSNAEKIRRISRLPL